MMSSSAPELVTLLPGCEAPGAVTVLRPARRWKSRILLPALILGTTTAIFAYTARSALLPTTEVWVSPVVAAPRTNPADLYHGTDSIPQSAATHEHGVILVQAPGWIEPAPYAVSVPALTEGVIKEILVLEGDRIEEGQVVARLIDEDARLNVRSAEAQLASLRAGMTEAMANVHAAESLVAEIDDQLRRALQLTTSGVVPEQQRVQLTIRLQAARQSVEAKNAAVEVAAADVRKQEVACEGAQLALKRTQIVAPRSGVVMSRLVEPGSRISMSARPVGESMSGAILRLYDPSHLQVRVDVPLADFAKLRIGSDAEVVTEALPDVVFHGVISRVVHEANIQRNTVPVKVSIDNPTEVLKPEMLARVRFYGSQDNTPSLPSESGHVTDQIAGSGLRLLIPGSALLGQTSQQQCVWLVKHDTRAGEMIAVRQDVRTVSSNIAGYVEVVAGLQAGDRVIIDPLSNLETGSHVRILGEKQTESPHSETRS